jgi:hypothetical protein
LRTFLVGHQVAATYEHGWSTLNNGELLDVAGREFDLLITTDHGLRHQQRLSGRRLSILVLPTTNWPRIREHGPQILQEVGSMAPGEYRELTW